MQVGDIASEFHFMPISSDEALRKRAAEVRSDIEDNSWTTRWRKSNVLDTILAVLCSQIDISNYVLQSPAD